MAIGLVGVQQVATITLGASGTADAIGSVFAVRASAPFKNLSILVRPVEDPSPFKVDVYFDGEIEESHDYPAPAGRTLCHMHFKEYLFPANTGTTTIPKFLGRHFPGSSIQVSISNYLSTQKTFEVYAVFEMYETPQFAVLQ